VILILILKGWLGLVFSEQVSGSYCILLPPFLPECEGDVSTPSSPQLDSKE
jgi:hypothetical protein